MIEDIKIITYSEILRELELSSQSSQCSNLLLGNGFNASLGIATDYKSIFKKMIEEDSIYEEIRLTMEEQGYNLEKLIGLLERCVKENSDFNGSLNRFLKSYTSNKVKLDFMKAGSSIVREEVKKIYQDNNRNTYLLFKYFSNYFTLNYDTFLYLILMKFKESELPSPQSLDKTSEIRTEIKRFWESGKIITQVDNEEMLDTDLNRLTKATFESIIKMYANRNQKNWKHKNIKRACDSLWEERNSNLINTMNDRLEVKDGFRGELFQSNDHDGSQNIFFLHGSFHIYEDNRNIKKIIQKQDRTVYNRLEEIIHADEKNVICIFANESRDKMKQIQTNQYLNKCLEKLSDLSGNLVILGASLDENDKHIFDAVNSSEICRLYISTSNRSKCKTFQKAKRFFPMKKIILFDYKTISYS